MNRAHSSVPRAAALAGVCAVGARLALAASMSLMYGCGFELAREVALPDGLRTGALATLASDHSDFYHGLQQALTRAGMRAPAADQPAVEVRILEDGYSERVLTVSAFNRPTAYEITYTVRFSVSQAGRELLAPETHSLSRDYSFDQSILLAKERERELLAAALAGELVNVAMQRIGSL